MPKRKQKAAGRAAAFARPDELNDKQRRFVAEYLGDLNATQAAIRAGYSKNTAYSCGPRLLEHAGVAKAIAEGLAAQRKRAEMTADDVVRVIEETINRCAQTEPVTDSKGNQIPGVYIFDAKNVLRGCELLGKRHGIFREKIEHSGTLEVRRTIVHAHRRDNGEGIEDAE